MVCYTSSGKQPDAIDAKVVNRLILKGCRIKSRFLKINLESRNRPQYICAPESKSETGKVEKFFDIMQQRTGKLF